MTLYKPLQAVYIKPKRLPVASLQMFPMRKLGNISAVPKATQYASKYGVKICKGKAASLKLLVYFEAVQKGSVSTAGAEIVNR